LATARRRPASASVTRTRFVVSVGGGWLALQLTGELTGVFSVLAAALVVFGLMNALSVAGGAWSGRLLWPGLSLVVANLVVPHRPK
jgi:hypothetical protein